MGGDGVDVVGHFHVEDGAAGVEGLDEVLDGALVQAALLLAELSVELVGEWGREGEVLDGSPEGGFL